MTRMNFDMQGTSDEILRRMTDEQIVEGIRRAQGGMRIAEIGIENPDDMWDGDHMDGPWPASQNAEIALQTLDLELHRKYSLALKILVGEQRRRALSAVTGV